MSILNLIKGIMNLTGKEKVSLVHRKTDILKGKAQNIKLSGIYPVLDLSSQTGTFFVEFSGTDKALVKFKLMHEVVQDLYSGNKHMEGNSSLLISVKDGKADKEVIYKRGGYVETLFAKDGTMTGCCYELDGLSGQFSVAFRNGFRTDDVVQFADGKPIRSLKQSELDEMARIAQEYPKVFYKERQEPSIRC